MARLRFLHRRRFNSTAEDTNIFPIIFQLSRLNIDRRPGILHWEQGRKMRLDQGSEPGSSHISWEVLDHFGAEMEKLEVHNVNTHLIRHHASGSISYTFCASCSRSLKARFPIPLPHIAAAPRLLRQAPTSISFHRFPFKLSTVAFSVKMIMLGQSPTERWRIDDDR